eukprot:scaffold1507_cov158-Ochromonas_danica.AAC.15
MSFGISSGGAGDSPSTRSMSPKSKATRKSIANRHSSFMHQMPIGGMFTKKEGFCKGPPAGAGIGLYAFDPFCPPHFAIGKYGKITIDLNQSQKDSTESAKEDKPAPPLDPPKTQRLEAPPLPPWLTKPIAKATTENAPKKLVIQKLAKKDAGDGESPQGWQAVLAEMQAKRAAMKNKGAPPPVKKEPEKKAPIKKIQSGKTKKKPGDFKDIMDELAYKFAVLRGDIKEDEKDGEEEEEEEEIAPGESSKSTKPPPPPPPPSRKTSTSSEAAAESPGKTVRKLTLKPDLAAMLAKVKSPPKPETTPPPPPSKPPLALPFKPPMGLPGGGKPAAKPIGKIAVDKPARLPAAPPLPLEWPPVPYQAPPGSSPPPLTIPSSDAKARKDKESAGPAQETPKAPPTSVSSSSSSSTSLEDLPEGYYIAAAPEDIVPPFGILHKGETTVEFVLRLSEMMSRAEELEYGADSYSTNFDNVQSSASLDQAELKAARKLTISDLPTPASFAAAIQRMKKSYQLRQANLEAEKQLEFRHYPSTPQSIKSQRGTGIAGGSSSSSLTSTTTPSKMSFFSDKYFERKSASFRPATEASDENLQPLYRRLQHSGQGAASHYMDADLSTSFWLKSLRSPDRPNARSQQQQQQFADRSVAANSPRDEFMNSLRSPTIARAPNLKTEAIFNRRESLRQSRQQSEQQTQQEIEQARKNLKERLYLQAMQSAKATGSYRPSSTRSTHQKLIEKYNRRPDVGVNLAVMVDQAYDQYATQLLSPERTGYEYSRGIEQSPGMGGYESMMYYQGEEDCSYGKQMELDDLLSEYDD